MQTSEQRSFMKFGAPVKYMESWKIVSYGEWMKFIFNLTLAPRRVCNTHEIISKYKFSNGTTTNTCYSCILARFDDSFFYHSNLIASFSAQIRRYRVESNFSELFPRIVFFFVDIVVDQVWIDILKTWNRIFWLLIVRHVAIRRYIRCHWISIFVADPIFATHRKSSHLWFRTGHYMYKFTIIFSCSPQKP